MRLIYKVTIGACFASILAALIHQLYLGFHLDILSDIREIFIKTEESKYCQSQACKDESLRLWINGNRSVHPCDNFYNYVCGNFSYTAKTTGKSMIDQLSMVKDKIDEKLKEELAKPDWSDKTSVKLIKTFYEKCSHEESEDVYQEILTYINVRLGGWPLLEKKKINDMRKWYNAIERLKSENLDIKLPFHYTVDQRNESHKSIHIWPASSLINTQLNFDDDIERNFEKLSKIAVLLGGSSQVVKSEIQSMYHIELYLRKIDHPGNIVEAVFNSTELSSQLRGIDWEELFKILLEREESIADFHSIIVHHVNRMKTISFLMIGHGMSFTNFLIWNAIAPWQVLLNIKMREGYVNDGSITPDKEKLFRENDCLKMLHKTIALNGYYTRKFLMNTWKFEAENMFNMIKKQAKRHLQTISRKDQSAFRAMKNLKNLNSMIAYPYVLKNEVQLDMYYNITANENKTALEIFIEIIKAEEDMFFDLREDIKNNIESMRDLKIADIDIGYDYDFHKIMIPGGALQSPLYMSDRPMYLNFAGIGFAFGHEIVHAFDSYDTSKTFCLEDQFSKYVLSQINTPVNGLATVNENYADNVGTQVAYSAYKVWKAKQEKDELPLLHFRSHTPEQMFWISAASTWCEYEEDDVLKQTILHDEHSPGEARINVGFSNLIDFATDFGCSKTSKMNPRNKCV